jgi:DNA-binding CsgD family transcriptional regulator
MRNLFGAHNTRELVDMLVTYFIDDNLTTEQRRIELRLSPRGREALELLALGYSYMQTAKAMGISRSGVRRHLENILWRNGCDSLDEAISRYRAQLAAKRLEAVGASSGEGRLS